MAKVLIVDDDIELVTTIEAVLNEAHWITETAHNGSDARQLLKNFVFDLIILDWHLPDMTGIQICQEFRAAGGETPIMFLTGRGASPDKELGFDSGADDYITKPFDNREFLARTRALMRRPAHITVEKLEINGVKLDAKGKKLFTDKQNIQLSATEFSIIEFFFKNAGTFYTAEQLFQAIWPSETETSSEVVRVHIRVLRRKLDLAGFKDIIKTVRGAGYIVEKQT